MKHYRKIIISIFLTLVICASLFLMDSGHAQTTQNTSILYWGQQGDKVIEVQVKLKNWGYYDGIVDGIYLGITFEAVRSFQRKNGLTPDGVVGQDTSAALGIVLDGSSAMNSSQPVSRGDDNRGTIYLLAQAVYAEARGEPYVGQVAVAAVILNRVGNSSFPNTIPGVIFQPGAFTAVDDGQINLSPDSSALSAARDALNGWDPTGGAIYYYNPATSTSTWIWSRPVHIVIGKHRFAT